MKKAHLLALTVLIVALYANSIFAQEIKVGGKSFQFSEILSKTKLEGDIVTNPIDYKIVTIRFAPGSSWKQQLPELQNRIWGLNKLNFSFNIFSDYSPFYQLEGELLFYPNTKFGTVRVEIYTVSYAERHRFSRLTDIWNKILVITEKSRETDGMGLSCVEMTGLLYLSDAVQENTVMTLDESEWKFNFDPQSAELVNCNKK
ncbi:MAG: hypothetical protein HYT98_03115 [Candidatus Sungbacteria bacterium]|nr:hypothetical protein [Candidatus Sungbacteria bacterium]